jgi:hypothetical protein
MVAFVSLLSGLSLCVLGCPKSTPATTDAGPTAVSSDASPTAEAEAGSHSGAADENVQPVYPIEPKAPMLAIAEKLCNALTTDRERKRADCCKTSPGIVLSEPCARQLSAAIRHNALALEEKDVDACIAASNKALQGCDWVGPFPPPPPTECQGIFKGKLAAGTKCRSSLECEGALRCHGLGPTTPGKCGPANAAEETCGGTEDSLATYTRQDDVDKRHPECKDRCIKHKCQPPVGEGGACLITNDCQDGMQCVPSGAPSTRPGIVPKKCVAGKAPGKDGEACPGGTCEAPLECIRGKCTSRKAGGEACTDDFECRGGCLKADGGAKGVCGPRCDIR